MKKTLCPITKTVSVSHILKQCHVHIALVEPYFEPVVSRPSTEKGKLCCRKCNNHAFNHAHFDFLTIMCLTIV